MFPNVRLMVAAVVASIMALSFGFGLFAAVRVNHEPLAGPTPLQLAAAHVTPPVETLTAGGTFGVRYRVVQLPLADPDAGLSALKVSLRDSVEPTNTVALAGPGADPQAQSGAAAPAPELNGQQSGAAVDEPAQAASAGSVSAPDVPASGLDAAAPAQAAGVAPAPVSEPDANAAAAGGVSAEPMPAAPMPAAPPQTAAIETPADQAQPVEESSEADTPASAPSTAAATPPKHRHRIVRRTANRQSVVRVQRARIARVDAIAPSNPPTDNYLQPHFQTAPAPAPSARRRPAAKAAVKAGAKPAAKTSAAKTSAAGSPLASPPTY
jgi:hypothetical protein